MTSSQQPYQQLKARIEGVYKKQLKYFINVETRNSLSAYKYLEINDKNGRGYFGHL